MNLDEERIMWLECLIAEYSRIWDLLLCQEDEDPLATQEMLRECWALVADLRRQLKTEPQEEPAAVSDGDIPF